MEINQIRRALLTLALYGLCLAANAQAFVLIQGDTIWGEVQVQLQNPKYERCTFRADSAATFQDYNAAEVEAYGLLPKWKYQSFILPEEGQAVFMRCLFEGEASLFLYKNRYFLWSNRKEKLLELPMEEKLIKKNEQLYSQVDPELTEIIFNEIRYCEKMARLDKPVNNSISEIQKLLEDYHLCQALPFHIYKKDQPGVKGSFGLIAAGQYDRIDVLNVPILASYSGIDLPQLFRGHFGIQLLFNPNIAHFPYLIRVEAHYHAYSTIGYFEEITNQRAVRYDLEIDRLGLGLIFGLRRYIQVGKIPTFVDLATNRKLFFRSTQINTQHIEDLDEQTVAVAQELLLNDLPRDIGLELGAGLQIFKRNRVGLELGAYVGTSGNRIRTEGRNFNQQIETRIAFSLFFK
ncbi:MAG: hypothetical protein AAF927_13395 [Bacteroidota bacterium]